MIIRFSKIHLAALTVSVVLVCHALTLNVSGCGGDWSEMALQNGGRMVAAAPGFYFENEVRELAKQFSAKYKAVPPEIEDVWVGGPDDPQRQWQGRRPAVETLTAAADRDDFAKALPKNAAAQARHRAAREFITVSGTADTAPLPVEPAGEFADYHRGALLFKRGNFAAASEEWKKLLARPSAERRWRSTWAAFMLGKIALGEKDYAAAEKFFQQTRKLADDGFADSLGLAASSLGWEALANLRGKNFARAAELYMRQLATGDDSAVVSLRVTVRAAGDDVCAADPLLRKINMANLLARYDVGSDVGERDAAPCEQWLAAVERAGVKAGAAGDADRLASLAYSAGKFDVAKRWLKLADRDSGLSLWLRSKLAFRDGDAKTALTLMERAAQKLTNTQSPDDCGGYYSYTPYYFADAQDRQARVNLGLLQVADADFVSAAKNFLAADYWSDAAFLAENVLTVDELKNLVNRKFKTNNDPTNNDDGERADMRWLLARRLVRLGQFDEARQFFPKKWRKQLDRYTDALTVAHNQRLPDRQRAAAYWRAALTMRRHGMELSGTQLWPDGFMSLGVFREYDLRRERLTGFYPEYGYWDDASRTFPVVLPATVSERARLKKSAVMPEKRFHYRYLAADLAWEAAKLMPADNEQTALVLNSAGRWLCSSAIFDDAAADRFYQEIERKCPRTELGRAAVKRHWFVPAEEPESL